jgi:glutaredoxin 2
VLVKQKLYQIEEQEAMFANMAQTLEKAMKESPKPEIDGLKKEFKAFSKGFENMTITLNKNFQTFLEQVQKQADNKEFKKLLSNSEALNKNTGDIMSTLNAMDKKYQETKAVLELITSNDANIFKTLEEFKATASEFESIAPTLKEVSTKEDFNILHERLAAIALFLNNLREFLISTDNQNKEKLNEYSMLIEKRLLEVKGSDDVSKLQGELDILNKDLRSILNGVKTDISNDVINTIEAKSEETQQKFSTQLNKAVENLSNLANEILALDNTLSQTLTGTGKDIKTD